MAHRRKTILKKENVPKGFPSEEKLAGAEATWQMDISPFAPD